MVAVGLCIKQPLITVITVTVDLNLGTVNLNVSIEYTIPVLAYSLDFLTKLPQRFFSESTNVIQFLADL